MTTSSENIKVIIRVRPRIENEYNQNCNCLKIEGDSIVATSRTDTKQFTFDYIATEESSQSEIFIQGAKEICDSVLQGYNGTIFVYGQTGAGKTYTLLGPKYSLSNKNNNISNNDDTSEHSNSMYEELNKGILPRTIEYLFIRSRSMENSTVKLSCSFIEIYMEQISDLLNPANNGNKSLNIQCVGDKITVDGLSKLSIDNAEEAYSLILKGSKLRHIASTSMNKESSRSHAVFSIYIDNKIFDTNKNSYITRQSVFHLIDLAGSERQKTAETSGERLKEAAVINKSLMNLSFVIKNLSENNTNKHIHFRDSKLTLLLKDSLGGNAKTCIIANVSPAYCNINETISTLCFAQRAKMIKNKAIINEVDTNDDSQYVKEILRLKERYNAIKAENFYLLSLIEKKKTPSPNGNAAEIAQANAAKQSNFVKTIDSVESEIEKMVNEISLKDEIINELTKEENYLSDKMQKVQLDITLKEKEISETEEKIQNMKSMYTDALSQINEYNDQNSDLAREISEKRNELNHCQMENDKEINKFKMIIEDTNRIFNEKNQSLQQVSEQKNKKILEKANNEVMIKTIDERIEMEKKDIVKRAETIEEYKKMIQSKMDMISQLKKEVDNRKAEIEQYQKKQQSIKIKLEKYVKDFENQSTMIPKLIKNIESDIKSSISLNNELREKITNIKIEKDKNDNEYIESNKVVDIKMEEIESITKSTEELLKQLNRIDDDNNKLQKEIDLLSLTDPEGKNSTGNKILVLNQSKHENIELIEELNRIKREYNALQKNTKNILNIYKDNKEIDIKPNIESVSEYLTSKEKSISLLHSIMQESVDKVLPNLPINGQTPIDSNSDIQNQFNVYFNKLFDINDEINEKISSLTEEFEKKNELISSIKREILVSKNNINSKLNTSLSSISSGTERLSVSENTTKRNSALMSSLVKTEEHVKIYRSVFSTKRKYKEYIPLNFEKENNIRRNFELFTKK